MPGKVEKWVFKVHTWYLKKSLLTFTNQRDFPILSFTLFRFYKTVTSGPLNVIEFNLLPRASYRENNLQRNFYTLFPALAKNIAKVH